VRFLNGPLAGQTEVLSKASTLIGRAPTCDIKIPNVNISKEHVRIELFADKVIVTDVGSRNGTFINGVQVRSTKAQSGDKVAIHEIFFEIQQVPESWAGQFQQQPSYGAPATHGNLAYQQQSYAAPEAMHAHRVDHNVEADPQRGLQASALQDLIQGKFPKWATLYNEYLERVVLPGLYKLPETFEFKWVLAGFMALFILLVTTLSTLPLIRILRASIEEESQQHAITIASTLARINLPALQQGLDSSVSVEIATSRPGVKKAYILSNVDGNIMAPAAQAGSYPELPYVHEGRKKDRESVAQVDDSTVMAMVPVKFFNSETGSHAVVAWAVVYYDMSSLAVDNSQVLSLFVTTLFIALLLGAILFYLLQKLIEHPLRSLNSQLDLALKEGHETVSVAFQLPALQLLASNVSSALSRSVQGSDSPNASLARVMEHDRSREVINLVELIGFAAMGIRSDDLSIMAVNQAFESRLGTSADHLTSTSIHDLGDQALRLSMKDLIERVDHNPDEIVSNEIEFSGTSFQLVAQAVFGTSKIAYYLIVLLPTQEGAE